MIKEEWRCVRQEVNPNQDEDPTTPLEHASFIMYRMRESGAMPRASHALLHI